MIISKERLAELTKKYRPEDPENARIPVVQIQTPTPIPTPSTNPIDQRIRYLSYSSDVLLHKCPRKYQLYKLGHQTEEPEDAMGQLTFDFGHTVGTGVQNLFMGWSLEKTIWNAFKNWKLELFVENPKQKKSFFLAVYALQKFEAMMRSGYLQDYELMYYDQTNGESAIECVVPAVELSFRILFPGGFIHRGQVDVILRNKYTGEIIVIEVKTDSGYDVAPAKYKNSAQGVGYSVVLDVIEPTSSAYNVLYLVYSTKKQEWVPLEFAKSHSQRALWIQEKLLDIDMIKAYEAAGVYPMHGESCYDFFRDCEYLGTCTLDTRYLKKEYMPEKDKELEKTYLFTFTLEDIISGQLNRI